jgi:hypothetical protein
MSFGVESSSGGVSCEVDDIVVAVCCNLSSILNSKHLLLALDLSPCLHLVLLSIDHQGKGHRETREKARKATRATPCFDAVTSTFSILPL